MSYLYGSAASLSPSPKKFKAKTVIITGATGNINQGCSATALIFCASFNRTPQLVIGGLKPKPKNDKAVSPSIIAGIDKVAEAIR